MFIEPRITGDKIGWIEVICGSMFSGKTEELIRRIKRAEFANQKVEIYKPSVDKRYDDTKVVSHNASAVEGIPVEHSESILLMVGNVHIVAIDEAQFFDPQIVSVCETLALRGIRVIVAGLDMDFKGVPFGPMPHLLAIADYITKLHAICMQCGNIANISHRKTTQTQAQQQVLLGEKDIYEPLCRKCHHEKS